MTSRQDEGIEEQATALGAGKEARRNFLVLSGSSLFKRLCYLNQVCPCAQVLHFFYDLTSVEQVRHLGCYTVMHGKGAFRKHICCSHALMAPARRVLLVHPHTRLL